ncbi:MAG: glutamate-5-semialdehyde dehydrogenase [Pseudanabaenaceae cyanobacterium]|jgi:glutamate-5-semialdehyde dehydrogenase
MDNADLTTFVHRAYTSAAELVRFNSKQRGVLIAAVAESIRKQKNQILEANTLDLESCRDLAVPDLVLDWVKLTPERLTNTADCLSAIAAAPDPLTTVFYQEGFRRIPLGTVAFVHEGFPQLAVIAAAMCLKVASSTIIKGGNECSHTQKIFVEIIRDQLDKHNFPENTIVVPPPGSALKDLLTQERYLRLVIPYGRPSFVQQVSKQVTISVLPTAMGNCYLYVAPSGDLAQAKSIFLESHRSDPDPVNAVEKIILHRSWLTKDLVPWLESLRSAGFTLKGCDVMMTYARQIWEWDSYSFTPMGNTTIEPVTSENFWGQACLNKTVALKVVDSNEEAITWMNQYSSGHADVLVTDSLQESQQFSQSVNSSTIYINTSNRFRRYNTAENSSNLNNSRIILGMSSLKTRGASRFPGFIDLHTLTTIKQIISG